LFLATSEICFSQKKDLYSTNLKNENKVIVNNGKKWIYHFTPDNLDSTESMNFFYWLREDEYIKFFEIKDNDSTFLYETDLWLLQNKTGVAHIFYENEFDLVMFIENKKFYILFDDCFIHKSIIFREKKYRIDEPIYNHRLFEEH